MQVIKRQKLFGTMVFVLGQLEPRFGTMLGQRGKKANTVTAHPRKPKPDSVFLNKKGSEHDSSH